MNQTELNKKYIRQRIPQQQQTLFYDYFTQLQDCTNFDQWTQQRTEQVVEQFQQIHPNNPNQQISNSPEPEKETNITDYNAIRTIATTTVKIEPNNNTEKRPSAISLLAEIQQTFSQNTTRRNIFPNSNPKNNNQNIWLAFPPPELKAQNSTNNTVDPFENFDSFITSSPKKHPSQQPPTSENKSQPSSPVSEEKYSLKRSQQIKRFSDTEHRKEKPLKPEQTAIKTKKNPQNDKIFKWKLHEELACRRLTNPPIKAKVTISNHQIVHRIFFPDYAIYHVTVEPGHITLKRTYDDFLELRTRLEKMYPGIKVPSVENSGWFSESDIALININKVMLEQFLNDIIEHPTLAQTELLREFLAAPEQKQIQKILEDYSKIPHCPSFAEMANQEGILKIRLSEQNFKTVEQLPKWKKILSNYLDRSIDLTSTLVSQYEAIKLTCQQITTLSSEFQCKLKQSAQLKAIMNPCQRWDQFIDEQCRFYSKKRNDLEKDMVNLKEKYLSILKYQRHNISSFEPWIQNLKSLTEKYLKRLENQPESPSSDLQSSQIAGRNKKFSDDLWHESEDITLLKYQVGHLHHQLLQQTQTFNQKLALNLQLLWTQLFTPNHAPN